MGAFISFTKTVIIPALIALSIYVFLTYVAIPLYRQHHQRYAQYLPLSDITRTTSSVWRRLYEGILKFVPHSWQGFGLSRRARYGNAPDVDDGGLFDDEEGEGLVGVDLDDSRRGTLARGNIVPDTQRRLSRDLEEGFRDDSDEEASIQQSQR